MNSREDIANDSRQLCTFMVDRICFGIDVLQVQEVLRFQEMTRVPLAPPLVRGLINLRGQIVMAIDLRRRLELPERPEGQLPINVVVRTADGVISFLVDELREVMRVLDDAFEEPPDTMTRLEREFVTGCYKLKDQLLLVLDTEKVSDIVQCVEEFLEESSVRL